MSHINSIQQVQHQHPEVWKRIATPGGTVSQMKLKAYAQKCGVKPVTGRGCTIINCQRLIAALPSSSPKRESEKLTYQEAMGYCNNSPTEVLAWHEGELVRCNTTGSLLSATPPPKHWCGSGIQFVAEPHDGCQVWYNITDRLSGKTLLAPANETDLHAITDAVRAIDSLSVCWHEALPRTSMIIDGHEHTETAEEANARAEEQTQALADAVAALNRCGISVMAAGARTLLYENTVSLTTHSASKELCASDSVATRLLRMSGYHGVDLRAFGLQSVLFSDNVVR